MPTETLENGQVVDVENSIILNVDQLKEMGFNSVADVSAKLTTAVKYAKDRDSIERIAQAVHEQNETMKTLAEAFRANLEKTEDGDKFEQLTKDKVVDYYKSLPVDDETRKHLKNTIAAEYGLRNADLILEGSTLKQVMERPITKSHNSYGETNDIRNLHDMAYVLTAAQEGVNKLVGSGEKDAVNINWDLFKASMGRIVKETGDQRSMDYLVKTNPALNESTANQGQEYVPVILSSNLAAEVYLPLNAAQLFQRIYMPSEFYNIPQRTARGLGYRMNEAVNATQFFNILATSKQMVTNKVSFTANKLASLQFLSDELDQDSVVPILTLMLQDVAWGLGVCIEEAIINGSNNGSYNDLDNQGSDGNRLWNNTAYNTAPASNTQGIDARSTWNGLRKMSANNSGSAQVDMGNTSPTLANMRQIRRGMGKYAVDPSGLAWLCGTQSYIDMLSFPEVLTMEKFSQNATVLTGELLKVDGMPVVVNSYIHNYYNASGVYDNVTTNRTLLLCVNRLAALFGDRQMVRVESERQALAGQRFILATWRGDFECQFANTEPVIGEGYDLKG